MASTVDIERALASLAERNEALERENKILREQLAALKQARFGRSTERIDAGQLGLFLDGVPSEAEDADRGAPAPAATSGRKAKKGHGRAPFAADLPRRTIDLDVPEADRLCPCCGKMMQLIGEDVTERGHVIPAQVVVNRYVRKKYACPDGHAVKTASAPEGVVEGAKYEASVVAHIATAKYSDHLPLHRLEGIFKRQGVHLPKQTMWDMLVRLDEIVAQPVLRQMHLELLEEPVLHADETPITLCAENGKGSSKAYAFGWRNLREADSSKVLIDFRTSRGRDGPIGFLGEWSGTMIADGYSGYDEAVRRNGIVRAGCWAHARRKLKQAMETGSPSAARVFVHVQRLFWLERAIKRRVERDGLVAEEREALRARVRQERSRVVIERIYAAAGELAIQRSTLPKSKLGKALGYLDRQREELTVFLADARIPIHNNDSERDLRHLALGRNNWLVFASPRGGEVACRLYSLVLSCRQSGVDPEAYLEDILAKVSTTPASQIASLTPWAWAKERQQS